MTTPNAPFDGFLRGDVAALDSNQKAGLKLFIDKGCATCHAGVNVSGAMYAKFGVAAAPEAKYRPPGDVGRAGVTGDASDTFVYKVPSCAMSRWQRRIFIPDWNRIC